MNEAASVFLRADIQIQDGNNLADWMNDRQITQYLNEEEGVSEEILALLDRAPSGMLTYHLNQHGRFFMICAQAGCSIGFIKLASCAGKSCEIVYAIGEKLLWGRGYGRRALDLALGEAFFEMRMERMTARIMRANLRSIRAAVHCGMRCTAQKSGLLIYAITAEEYIAHKLRAQKAPKNAVPHYQPPTRAASL